MTAPIPRTYWMNFSTGEQYHPPKKCPDEERIPFPYSYQRIILDDADFQECKAEFTKRANERRFQYVFNARIAKK